MAPRLISFPWLSLTDGAFDPFFGLMSRVGARWPGNARGSGQRSNPRAPKKYDGATLRALRAERGVGRPPQKLSACADCEAGHA